MPKRSPAPEPAPRRSARPQGPRVGLTLTPELDHVLTRLTSAMGTGKASFIREMLIGALPQLEHMAQAAELVAKKNIPAGLTMMAQVMRDASGLADQAELQLTKTRRAVRRKLRDSGQ